MTASTALQHIRSAGFSARVEGTGGNCTAVIVRGDGWHAYVTSSEYDLTAPDGAERQQTWHIDDRAAFIAVARAYETCA